MSETITTPSKSKTWIGLVGSALTALVPFILSASTSLPEPWPLVIGGIIAAATGLGIYKAPYVPPNATAVRHGTGDPVVTLDQPGGRPWPKP